MEIINSLIEFFGINSLNELSTLPDLITYVFCVCVAIFLVCFVFRTIFVLVSKI